MYMCDWWQSLDALNSLFSSIHSVIHIVLGLEPAQDVY